MNGVSKSESPGQLTQSTAATFQFGIVASTPRISILHSESLSVKNVVGFLMGVGRSQFWQLGLYELMVGDRNWVEE